MRNGVGPGLRRRDGHFVPVGLNIHADVVSSVRAVYVRFFLMAHTFI